MKTSLFIFFIFSIFILSNGCDEDEVITSNSNIYFQGIVNTNSEGNIISEDVEDWQPRYKGGNNSDSIYSLPAYPNPAGKDSVWLDLTPHGVIACVLQFIIPFDALITITVNDKPDRVVRTLLNESEKSAGYYRIAWDLKNENSNLLSKGIYRVYMTAKTNTTGKVTNTYGDIQIY